MNRFRENKISTKTSIPYGSHDVMRLSHAIELGIRKLKDNNVLLAPIIFGVPKSCSETKHLAKGASRAPTIDVNAKQSRDYGYFPPDFFSEPEIKLVQAGKTYVAVFLVTENPLAEWVSKNDQGGLLIVVRNMVKNPRSKNPKIKGSYGKKVIGKLKTLDYQTDYVYFSGKESIAQVAKNLRGVFGRENMSPERLVDAVESWMKFHAGAVKGAGALAQIREVAAIPCNKVEEFLKAIRA